VKIALISDAWQPQVNGVVRTLNSLRDHLERAGHEMMVIHPELFFTMPLPRYPSIKLAIKPGRKVAKFLRAYRPDAIHIATEGPLGSAARSYCLHRNLPFTTSYHTHFPPVLRIYYKLPESWGWKFLRWFHRPAVRTMAPTESVVGELRENGFDGDLVVWGRGVDTVKFAPRLNGQIPAADDPTQGLPRPIFLNVGRVAFEKNLGAFAALDLPGTKIIVGEGPALRSLQRDHADVRFTGFVSDEVLARYYAAADVFVFPSLTDTFGNVMLEALSCGTPVAAYPVTGPRDFIRQGETGVLDDDLHKAALEAQRLDRAACRTYAEQRPWTELSQVFLEYLHPHCNRRPAATV